MEAGVTDRLKEDKMICDHVSNIKNYYGINEDMDAALSSIETTIFDRLETGKHIVKENIAHYNIVQTHTKDLSECFYEIHRKHIDIHLVLEGVEKMRIAHVNTTRPEEAYDETADFQKVAGTMQEEVILTPGQFVICFPQDAHMTLICQGVPGKLKKVIFKILCECRGGCYE